MRKALLKVTSMLVISVMVSAMAVGCEMQETKPADSTKPVTTAQSNSQQASMYPISQNGLQLTVFGAMDGYMNYIQDYNQLEAFKEAERITGIKIKWIIPPDASKAEQFRLLFASGDHPDIVYADWSGIGVSPAAGGAVKYADDGYIITLNDPENDLISKAAPNLKKIIEEKPTVKKELVDDTGKMYIFPMLRLDKGLRVFKGFQMRQDWLVKLNLKAPTTTDEWYTVLKAFKERDPNGNGKADEIPLSGTRWNSNNDIRRFAYSFGAWTDFFVKDGKITFGPTEGGYKNFLVFLNKLYKEGLLDSDFAVQDEKAMRNKILTEVTGSWFGFSGGGMTTYTNLMTQPSADGKPAINPNFSLIGVPWPKSADGKAYVIDGEYVNTAVTGLSSAVTASSKYKEEAVRWIDFGYSKEGQIAYNYGKEGVTFYMVNGMPKYADLFYEDTNVKWPDSLMKYVVPQSWVTIQGLSYFEQFQAKPAQNAIKVWAQADTSRTIPPIKLTAEESQQFSSIMNAIRTYVEEYSLKIIMGKEPVDYFDKFVQDIKGMNLDEATKLQQAAYDRYLKR